MKATRKTQKIWIENMIRENFDGKDYDGINDPFNAVLSDIRACSRDSRGGNYYGTPQAAAEHYLRGLGLSGFPYYDDDQEAQLSAWGYNPTPRMVENFWSISAGLLVEVLADHGCFIN